MVSQGTIVYSSWQGMERRKQERYRLEVPIKIKRYGDGRVSTFEAFSRNISSRGVLIKPCDIGLEPRQRVHLEFTLTIGKIKELFGYTGKIKLELDGSVLRSVGNGMAVEFENHYSILPEKKISPDADGIGAYHLDEKE
jgi:hypothetical protein